MAAIQEKNDVKIFILYILRHVGYPIDYATVIDLVLGGGIVRYFDFVECFYELVDTGSIDRCDKTMTGEYRPEELFMITEQGCSISDTLSTEIAAYIRDKSLRRALQYLSFHRDGTKVHLDIKSLYDQRSRIHFSLERDDETFLSIELISDNERMTERIRANVDNYPEDIYKNILSLLSSDLGYTYSNS